MNADAIALGLLDIFAVAILGILTLGVYRAFIVSTSKLQITFSCFELRDELAKLAKSGAVSENDPVYEDLMKMIRVLIRECEDLRVISVARKIKQITATDEEEVAEFEKQLVTSPEMTRIYSKLLHLACQAIYKNSITVRIALGIIFAVSEIAKIDWGIKLAKDVNLLKERDKKWASAANQLLAA